MNANNSIAVTSERQRKSGYFFNATMKPLQYNIIMYETFENSYRRDGLLRLILL